MKDKNKLENTQNESLRRIVGAKAHSSSVAIEVITGIIPIKIRIRDLCSREYLRLITSPNCYYLTKLMETSSRKSLNFTPMCYLTTVSKQLCRSLDGCTIRGVPHTSSKILFSTSKLTTVSVITRGNRNYHDRSPGEQKQDVEEANDFIKAKKGKQVIVFTDGSVCSGTVGCGACAAVLIPPGEGVVVTDSKAVAMKTDSVTCEFEGVLLGVKLILNFFRTTSYRRSRESTCLHFQ